MADQTQHRTCGRRLAPWASALAAAFVLPWLLVTAIETDSGWEDAIWRYSSWSKTVAWATLACGAIAAASSIPLALRFRSATGRRPGVWLTTSLAVELAAFAGWVASIYTAPS